MASAGCSSALPPPPPVPEVAAEPVPAAQALALAPRAVAGSYRLRTEIQRTGRAAGRRQAAARETPMRLLAVPAATPDGMAGVATQYGASLTIPGYTSGGRSGGAQGGTWWPVAGDSVVVMFTGQRGNRVQLRGRVDGAGIRGEVWLLSIESGSTFQLGTFVATRAR